MEGGFSLHCERMCNEKGVPVLTRPYHFSIYYPYPNAVAGCHSDTNFYLEFASQAALHDIK